MGVRPGSSLYAERFRLEPWALFQVEALLLFGQVAFACASLFRGRNLTFCRAPDRSSATAEAFSVRAPVPTGPGHTNLAETVIEMFTAAPGCGLGIGQFCFFCSPFSSSAFRNRSRAWEGRAQRLRCISRVLPMTPALKSARCRLPRSMRAHPEKSRRWATALPDRNGSGRCWMGSGTRPACRGGGLILRIPPRTCRKPFDQE